MDFFSDNIIFLDTEFSSLNVYKGEVLSVGLVRRNGEELYLELEYEGEYDEWVEKNLLLTLKGPKVSRVEARQKIKSFIGNKKPFLVAYVNQFDMAYWFKLFRVDENPGHWVPIDFASVLFTLGIDPEVYNTKKKEFCAELGINLSNYQQHNALDDAKLLKDVYLKLLQLSRQDLERFKNELTEIQLKSNKTRGINL